MGRVGRKTILFGALFLVAGLATNCFAKDKKSEQIVEVNNADLTVQIVADRAYARLNERIHTDGSWFLVSLVVITLGALFAGHQVIQRAVESLAKDPVQNAIDSLSARKEELLSLIGEVRGRSKDQIELLAEMQRGLRELAAVRTELEKQLSSLGDRAKITDDKFGVLEQELDATQKVVQDTLKVEAEAAEKKYKELATILHVIMGNKKEFDGYLEKVKEIDAKLETQRDKLEKRNRIRVRISFDRFNATKAPEVRTFLISRGYRVFLKEFQNDDPAMPFRIRCKPMVLEEAKELATEVKHLAGIDDIAQYKSDAMHDPDTLVPDIAIRLSGSVLQSVLAAAAKKKFS